MKCYKLFSNLKYKLLHMLLKMIQYIIHFQLFKKIKYLYFILFSCLSLNFYSIYLFQSKILSGIEITKMKYSKVLPEFRM